MHSTGGGFQCPISNFVLRHCCHRTLAEFVNNDGHKARFPCGVYHVKRVEEKWGKKGEKKIAEKMHIAISGGKPTIPIFQYSDFRMCRTFLFILHRDWDKFWFRIRCFLIYFFWTWIVQNECQEIFFFRVYYCCFDYCRKIFQKILDNFDFLYIEVGFVLNFNLKFINDMYSLENINNKKR